MCVKINKDEFFVTLFPFENAQSMILFLDRRGVYLIIIIIIYLFYIALNPCTVLSASQLKGVTLHH